MKSIDLGQINQLISDGQLSAALLALNSLGRVGKYMERFHLAEKILHASQKLGQEDLIIDATISILNVSFYLKNHEECLELIKEAENWLKKQDVGLKDNVSRKAVLMTHKGRIYLSKGDYDQALEYLKQSLSLWRELNNKHGISWALHNIGYTLGAKGDSKRALDSLKRGLVLREELGSKHDLVLSLHLIGWIYWDSGKWDRAMEYYERSLNLSEELGIKYEIAHSFTDIAWVYRQKGDLDRALANLEQSLTLNEEIEDKNGIANSLLNISHIYREKGDLNQALERLQQSLKLFEDVGDEKGIYWYNTIIGTIYRLQGDLDQALENLQQGMKYFEEIRDKYGIAWCFVEIGNISRLKGNLDEALGYLQKGLVFYEELGYKFFIAGCLTRIGIIYRQKSDLDQALYHLEHSLRVYDEIGNNLYKSETLFFLISVAIDKKELHRAQIYLQHLEEINNQEENKIINQRYHVANALLLKTSPRVKNRGKAQELLEQLAKAEIIDHELTVTALLSLCDLLLLELHASGLSEVLDEVQMHVTSLSRIAQQQQSHWLLAETYVLRSKLALVELDLQNAQLLLDQAQQLAEEKKLTQLIERIRIEKDLFQDQIDNWRHLIQRNASMKERLELVQLESLIVQMARKRLMVTEEETLKYAQEAQRFVDEWKEIRKE